MGQYRRPFWTLRGRLLGCSLFPTISVTCPQCLKHSFANVCWLSMNTSARRTPRIWARLSRWSICAMLCIWSNSDKIHSKSLLFTFLLLDSKPVGQVGFVCTPISNCWSREEPNSTQRKLTPRTPLSRRTTWKPSPSPRIIRNSARELTKPDSRIPALYESACWAPSRLSFVLFPW